MVIRRRLFGFATLLLLVFSWRAAVSEPKSHENPKDGSVLVEVPAGDFWMGADNSGNTAREESPRHRVTVPRYYICKHLVTNQQFAAFVRATDYRPKGPWTPDLVFGEDRHPVTHITWYDADAYCSWAGGRLPSEAEWEKGARGVDGRLYPWGNDWNPNNCNSSVEGPSRGTMPVGSFPDGASPYGLLDMAGNAWEWTADWYHPYPGALTEDVDSHDRYKTVRGGSWRDRDPRYYRTTFRSPWPPDQSNAGLGFRYVMDP